MEKTPVYLSLGQHKESSIKTLSSPAHRILHNLDNSPGKVLYLTEEVYFLDALGKQVTDFTQNGLLPSDAFFGALYFEENLNYPKLDEMAQKDEFLKRRGTFGVAEIKMLDVLSTEYKGRVLLAVEPASVEDINNAPYRDDGKLKTHLAIDESYDVYKTGRFDEALELYKYAATTMAKEGAKREERVVNQIVSFVNDPEISLIVARFGATHTGIAHALKEADVNVEAVLEGKKESFPYHFSGFESALRFTRFFPNRHLNELQWYQSLTTTSLSYLLKVMAQSAGEEVHDQNVIRTMRRDTGLRFYNMEQIRRFEQMVRNQDFVDAVIDFS